MFGVASGRTLGSHFAVTLIASWGESSRQTKTQLVSVARLLSVFKLLSFLSFLRTSQPQGRAEIASKGPFSAQIGVFQAKPPFLSPSFRFSRNFSKGVAAKNVEVNKEGTIGTL